MKKNLRQLRNNRDVEKMQEKLIVLSKISRIPLALNNLAIFSNANNYYFYTKLTIHNNNELYCPNDPLTNIHC